MKWNKFCALQAKHPSLARDLRLHGDERIDKEFVRKKIDFIAFRPFEGLELSAKPSSSGIPLKSNYPNVTVESYESVNYSIVFHVEGENDGTRLRFVADDIGDGSIQAHIDEIATWFNSCDAFCGKQLIWERVVKKSIRGSSLVGMTSIRLEIYTFPRFYRFRPIPMAPLPPPNPGHRAYMSGGAMPPIIPGSLDFAG
jgi:hypothetical protein